MGQRKLFAALDIATGKVSGRHCNRRRRVEFLDFMNRVIAAYPDREIHVVIDNLSTHKPKRDLWLTRHPKKVHFHYTPTDTSWLNQIEIWFSILAGKSLERCVLPERRSTQGPHQRRSRRGGGWNWVGVVSGLFNPNDSGVDALERRPRHDERYHEGDGCRRRSFAFG